LVHARAVVPARSRQLGDDQGNHGGRFAPAEVREPLPGREPDGEVTGQPDVLAKPRIVILAWPGSPGQAFSS
jgi:hypothetical protein